MGIMTPKVKAKLLKRLKKFQIVYHEGNCYGWSGARCSRGLPRISVEGQSVGANRAAWMAHFGKIPEYYFIRHTCNNGTCTNPKHLFKSLSKTPPLRQDEKVNKRLRRERLGVDLPTRHVQGIKRNALKRNMTITRYVGLLVARALELERSYEKQED